MQKTFLNGRFALRIKKRDQQYAVLGCALSCYIMACLRATWPPHQPNAPNNGHSTFLESQIEHVAKKTEQEIQQTCWTNLSNASNWIQSLALPLYSFNVLSPIQTMPTPKNTTPEFLGRLVICQISSGKLSLSICFCSAALCHSYAFSWAQTRKVT